MKSTMPLLQKAMKKMDSNGVSLTFYNLSNLYLYLDWQRYRQVRKDLRGYGGQDW